MTIHFGVFIQMCKVYARGGGGGGGGDVLLGCCGDHDTPAEHAQHAHC